MRREKIYLAGIGLFFIIFLLLSLFYETGLKNSLVSRVSSITLDNQIKFPPFNPKIVPPFGTDLVGFTLLSKLVQGFKYTFSISLVLSVFQIALSFILGFLAIYKWQKTFIVTVFKYFATIFSLIPKPFLLALLILPVYSVIYLNEVPNTKTNSTLLLMQLLVLLGITIPDLVLIFNSEILHLFKKEYSEASRILGSSSWRMVFRSLRPQLSIVVLNLFFKTMIQNLAIFIYLSYFQLFLGGTIEVKLDAGVEYPISLSNEWSGIIGQNIKYLSTSPWTVLIPLLFYCILIFFLSQTNRLLKKILIGEEKYEYM